MKTSRNKLNSMTSDASDIISLGIKIIKPGGTGMLVFADNNIKNDPIIAAGTLPEVKEF